MSGSAPASAQQVLAFLPVAGTVGFSSSGTITVASTPVPAGETITYQGLTLTSVAGARTSGSNDFDGSGTVEAIAADIVAAMADPANAWATVVTASALGSVVSLTTIAVGYNTFGDLLSSDASMTTTGIAGGEVLLGSLLATATSMVNLNCWGEKTCDATIYLTLHFLASTIGGIPGSLGPASSIKIADIQKTYAIATPTDALFGSTQWGRMYMMLYDTVFCSGTTGSGICLGVTC
jgi:hypothetical protein